ncbi:hypothetical protein Athai_41410 [Actinocatenispora thailandica]|uniref:Uncharacterized protein n=1 Tax=Actinocatenispora thailandica TaxID=227318 RepID=A0A7R7HZ05_9ACTN|nr:hypothetical protein [Actinocatenispora thailandica]BCJ36638.1 hypothetical protein Athai_41410 [Actinocatenispora thailandica]
MYEQTGGEPSAGTRRWQWFVTPPAVLLSLAWYAGFVAGYVALVAAQTRHGGPVGALIAEGLPLLPPIAGAVLGARIARGRGLLRIVFHAAIGALLALAVVTVLLYGIVAFLAAVFNHPRPGG